jgi:aminoglycoside 3-N-acetyltransferase
MNEADVIRATPEPRTRQSLAADLRGLGLQPDMIVLVHSSLSALGWVNGGAVAVIQALLDGLSPGGTLMMPAHSGGLSDPAPWQNPPVPETWWPIVRETMPVFDPLRTPTSGMGAIPELFRTWPGVMRSHHPHFSFAAWGPRAGELTGDHSLDDGLGEASPLGRLYQLDGWVLLLGAGFDSNTSFHLAEYRVSSLTRVETRAPMLVDGQRQWRILNDVNLDSDRFSELGADFELAHPIHIGRVGSAKARLFEMRPAVDFATAWLTKPTA